MLGTAPPTAIPARRHSTRPVVSEGNKILEYACRAARARIVGVMVDVGASAKDERMAMRATNTASLLPGEKRRLGFAVGDIADAGLVGHLGYDGGDLETGRWEST